MGESTNRTDTADAGREITAQAFRRLHRRLWAQILSLGVPPVEVEDLIQETFLHAQRALDQGQFDGRSSLDTWIVSIAKRRTLKYRRSRRAAKRTAALVPLEPPGETEGDAPVPVSPEPDPQVTASDRQLLGRTIRAVASLPQSFRTPLVLSVGGHTYQQIAALLGIAPSAVTSRIHQARAKVRESLSRLVPGSSR